MTNSSSQRRALIVQNNSSPFGNKLIQSGFVNSEQLTQALAESRRSGESLATALEKIKGQPLPPDLLRQYKKQQLFELKILYGVESLDPEISQISANQMSQLIDTLIPIEICSRYKLLPLAQSDAQPPFVLVAMVDPDNLAAQDDLNRILRSKGLSLQRLVITLEDYQRLMSQHRDTALELQKQIDQQSMSSLI